MLTTGVYEDPAAGPTVLHFGVNLKAPGVKILDNWRTMGMRGTGSNDIVIENVDVQDASVSVRRPKGKWHQFWNVVSPLIWPLVISAYVGVAESAREIALAAAQKKKDDPLTQQLLGELDDELYTAQLVLDTAVAFANGLTYEPSLANADRVYRQKTIAAKAAVRTVNLAMELVGGASFFRAGGLERQFRDIQGIRFHPWHERRQYQFGGRIALGLDPV